MKLSNVKLIPVKNIHVTKKNQTILPSVSQAEINKVLETETMEDPIKVIPTGFNPETLDYEYRVQPGCEKALALAKAVKEQDPQIGETAFCVVINNDNDNNDNQNNDQSPSESHNEENSRQDGIASYQGVSRFLNNLDQARKGYPTKQPQKAIETKYSQHRPQLRLLAQNLRNSAKYRDIQAMLKAIRKVRPNLVTIRLNAKKETLKDEAAKVLEHLTEQDAISTFRELTLAK